MQNHCHETIESIYVVETIGIRFNIPLEFVFIRLFTGFLMIFFQVVFRLENIIVSQLQCFPLLQKLSQNAMSTKRSQTYSVL